LKLCAKEVLHGMGNRFESRYTNNPLSFMIDSMKETLLRIFFILVDIPFRIIFVLIALSALLLTCIWFFRISSVFLLVPIWILVIYTAVMTVYWIWLFVSSNRLQEELEVFEIMQKKSLGLCLSMELNLIMSLYYTYVSIRYQNQWFINSAFFYTSLVCHVKKLPVRQTVDVPAVQAVYDDGLSDVRDDVVSVLNDSHDRQ